MAFTDESNGMVMPVTPMCGGNNGGFGGGFGGDWGWIILLLLFASGGWGNGFGGGFGNGAMGYDFPWLLTGQQNINANTNNGFRDAMLNDGITSIRDGISGLSTQLCGCCSDMQMALANGFAGVEMGANARQIANMQTDFALSQQLAQCCCDNRLATANLGSDIAREACATRTNDTQNTQAILNAVNSGVQSIKDQICQDKIDSKNEKIVELQNQLNMATLKESQIAQNAFIQQGFSNEVDALYNRLSNCPVPSTPVYGRTPIFTCNNNNCGCGCGNF
jgi:hypothetical protein